LLSREVIESVKSRIDIVELISEYISLQKIGKNFRALCPFHNEKTPSFYVNSEKGLYHCFGCGASGDVIKFVQEIEGVSFIDALRKLAERVGIKIPEVYDSKANEEYIKYVKLYSKLSEIYHKNLFKYGKLLDYLLNSRGIDLNIIRKFKIGFCPPNSRIAHSEAKKLGIIDSEFVRFGLVNSKGIDLFNNRITFPIYNSKGHIIAFGGRILSKNGGEFPKYINTSETAFFSKSKEFFGSSKALEIAKEVNFVILVEGYFDVLALNTCGLENVLAPMGTTLSRNQIKRISRFTRNIILFFDSDDAGKKAIIKLIPRLEENDLNIAVVSLDEFKDASEVLQKKNQEYLKKCIKDAIGYEEFLIKEFSRKLDLENPSGIETFLEKLRPFALRMLEKRPVRYERLVEIITNELGLRETTVRSFFSRGSVNDHKKIQNSSNTSDNNKVGNRKKDEIDLLIKIFVEFKPFRERILEIMGNYRDILDDFGIAFLDLVENEEFFSEDVIIEKLSEEYSNRFFKILMMDIEQLNFEKVLLDCEDKLKKKRIMQEIHEIDKKLRIAKNEVKRDLLKRRMALLSHLKGGKSP